MRKRLSAIQTAVGKLTATVEAEIDGVRSARRPRFAQIPILGKKGSLYYFQKNRLEDPAQGLVDFANALKCADNYLEGEVLWIDNRVPLVKAGWKERPDIFLSKGGFTTELEDSFRSANLGMKEVHRRIERILYKLEGRSITIDPDSGQSSAIRQARRRKPESRQNYSEPKP